AAPEQLQALGEDVLQLLDGAALEQHVPVRADRLLGLYLGLDPVDRERLRAAARALPHGRDLGLGGHRDLEPVALRAGVAHLLSSGELDSSLVLEALASETGSSKCALCHGAPPTIGFAKAKKSGGLD